MKNDRNNTTDTVRLYETDGMLTEFAATVIGSGYDDKKKSHYVLLDRTAFFPEGGGQPADEGYIVCCKEKISVKDVQTVEGMIRHYVEHPLKEGEKITGRVDEDIRFPRMQNHGAEHLLCGIIHSLFGYENVGFHISGSEVIFDVDGPLLPEQIRDVERRANKAVLKNVPITISFPSEEEAKNTEYRSKLDTFEDIRLVTIEGYDVCACCAPQVPSTGSLGVIKITDYMPHRGGTRMTMVAGMSAYDDYTMLSDQNDSIVKTLSSKRDKTAGYVEDISSRYLALKEETTELRKMLSKTETKTVLEQIRKKGSDCKSPELIFTDVLDPTGLRNLVNACTSETDRIICAFLESKDGYRYIFAVNEKASEGAGLLNFANDFNKGCEGKGGGSAVMVQGTTSTTRQKIEEYFTKNHGFCG